MSMKKLHSTRSTERGRDRIWDALTWVATKSGGFFVPGRKESRRWSYRGRALLPNGHYVGWLGLLLVLVLVAGVAGQLQHPLLLLATPSPSARRTNGLNREKAHVAHGFTLIWSTTASRFEARHYLERLAPGQTPLSKWVVVVVVRVWSDAA